MEEKQRSAECFVCGRNNSPQVISNKKGAGGGGGAASLLLLQPKKLSCLVVFIFLDASLQPWTCVSCSWEILVGPPKHIRLFPTY
jgi:hypothetical protein